MQIILYTKSNCPNCTTAKHMLETKGIPYAAVNVDTSEGRQQLVENYPDIRQMPLIVLNGSPVSIAGLRTAIYQMEQGT